MVERAQYFWYNYSVTDTVTNERREVLMKRLSRSSITERHSFLLVSAIIIFSLSVVAVVVSLTNLIDPPYEDLPETTAVVAETYHDHGHFIQFFRIGGGTGLVTSDGSKFSIPYSVYSSGKITEGEQLTIKYRKTWVGDLLGISYAREIRSGEDVVMPYSPPNPRDVVVVCIICAVAILFSVFLFFIYRLGVRMDLEREEKRDKRIIKKYGKLDK